MNKVLLFVALLALAVFVLAAEEKTDVVDLDETTLEDVISKNEYVLIEFYAPWCPHCKKLVPIYEQVATALKGVMVVAKIDCDQNKNAPAKYNIPGFPVIKLFKNGKPYRDYEDDRSAEAIVAWAKRKTGPSTTSLTQDKVDEFVTKSGTEGAGVVVGFFESKNDAYKTFVNASDYIEDFPFAEVIGGSGNRVKLFRSTFGEENVEFDFAKDGGKDVGASLTAFIRNNGYPTVDEVNGKSFQRYAAANLPLAVAFLDYNNKDLKNQVVSVLRKTAEKFKGKFNFGYSDGAMYGEQLDIMGGNKTKLPGIAAMNLESRKNYPYSGENTVEALTAWVQGIIDGKIEPFLRSEAIPEKNDEPVKVVVGKSFNSIVLDDNNDVLLEFYAPWCGHCKKLAPKYDKLAQFFSSVKNLVIAKIDSTLNDTPINVEGFPTLYFFPKGGKAEPVQYEGNRSIEDLKKFIKDNAVASKDAVAALVKDAPKDAKKDTKKAQKDEL